MTENKTDNKFSHYEISEWDDSKLDLDTKLLRGIYAFGFEKPSAIQKKGLYPMTWRDNKGHGKDIIAQAQSGTGKTATFQWKSSFSRIDC